MKLITIIIGLFAFQISNASAINLLLDCKGKGGDKNSAVGRTGKVKLKTESLPPQNMMFKIENNTCYIDWGRSVGRFPLIEVTDEKYVCGSKKIKKDEQVDKDIQTWTILVNRMNGQLNFFYKWDYFSNKLDYKNFNVSEERFDCQKAKKLF